MTKRILSVLVAVLMVMALVPMTVFATGSAKAPVAPERDTFTYDFEGAADGWTFVDADGDGYNWELASVAYAGYIVPAYNGADCITSKSYDSSAGPLTPDNWAISPAVEAEDLSGVTISFWAQAQDADYAAEHFGLFVGNGNTPDDMVAIQEWDMTASVTRDTGNWYQYTANIGDAAVEPGTVYFGIRHFDCTDMFYLNVDLVEISVEEGSVEPTEPPAETEAPVASDLDAALNVEGGNLHFVTSETYPWEVFTDGDRVAAWSTNNGVSGSTSTVSTTVNANEGDTLSFDFMAWGEGSSTYWDKCEFKVDGVTVQSWGAYQNNDWETYTYTFTAGGEHELTWSYTKDSSVNPTGDYFAVDEVVLTAGEPVETEAPTDEPVVTPEPSEPVTGLIAGYYFETQEQVDEWTFIGTDETNWVWSDNNPGGYDYTEFAHEGGHFIMSYSFVDYVGAYQADNWAISPAVTLPEGEASVSFYANQANASYPETISVYVGLTPNTADMSLLQADVAPTTGYDDEWTRYELDLSLYAGETIYLAFYDNCYDCYEIWIDQVEFFGEGGEPVVTPEPTEVPQPTEPGDMTDLDRALNIEGGTIHFVSEGQYPWITVEEGDRFYAKSGNAGITSSTSVVSTTVDAQEGDVVQFEFKAWGEGSSTFWDHCDFAVDGQVVMTYGAYDNDWTVFNYMLSAGQHTLTWSYTKDSSVNPTGDYFAVDNVYVGEPVHVEEIIATESLEIPMNRTGVIEWTVLPEAAANKAVTFVSDDPSIATVNENGVVFGVAEGETFVTIASAENPQIFAVCEITVVDTGLTMAQIYGICTYDMGSVYDNNWVTFTDVDPGTVSSIATAPEAFGVAYAYGTVFGFTTEGVYFTAPFDNLGNVTYGASFSGGTVTSLSYDYTRGSIFGIAADDNGYSYFINVDPASGAVTTVTTNSQHYYGFCIDENGTGYGIANTGDLYAINLDTGAATLVGNTGVSCSYVQDLAYDFNTGDIYWAQILNQTSHGLYRIDKNTGNATFCGTIGNSGMEIVGMFLIPDAEPGSGDEHPVTGVAINPTEVTIHVGDTAQFAASVQPFNADNKNVEWSVDDESIIMVDQNGLVVGLAEGTAMVCVTTEEGGFQAYAIVNVIPEIGGLVEGFYFEDQAEVDGWTFVDQDGDGHNWIWNLGPDGSTGMTPYEGQGIIYSESYVNDDAGGGVAVNPDNWAISPAIDLPDGSATVTLFAAGQDPSYADEHFAIYAGLTPNPADMIQVSPEFIVTADYVQYEANLADFTGETVYIAIRHFNITDMFILNIDQVEVWGSDEGPQPTHLWGDADGDNDVDSVDVLLLMRFAMNLVELDPANIDPWCDVNGDGVVNMTDALLVARYVNGTISELPCF